MAGNKILINVDIGETRVALIENGIVAELHIERKGDRDVVGNVYLGKVQNVLPSMEAAFVDIGRGRNGVLYAGEVNWEAAEPDGSRYPANLKVILAWIRSQKTAPTLADIKKKAAAA